jgi:hypothetical protein
VFGDLKRLVLPVVFGALLTVFNYSVLTFGSAIKFNRE